MRLCSQTSFSPVTFHCMIFGVASQKRDALTFFLSLLHLSFRFVHNHMGADRPNGILDQNTQPKINTVPLLSVIKQHVTQCGAVVHWCRRWMSWQGGISDSGYVHFIIVGVLLTILPDSSFSHESCNYYCDEFNTCWTALQITSDSSIVCKRLWTSADSL